MTPMPCDPITVFFLENDDDPKSRTPYRGTVLAIIKGSIEVGWLDDDDGTGTYLLGEDDEWVLGWPLEAAPTAPRVSATGLALNSNTAGRHTGEALINMCIKVYKAQKGGWFAGRVIDFDGDHDPACYLVRYDDDLLPSGWEMLNNADHPVYSEGISDELNRNLPFVLVGETSHSSHCERSSVPPTTTLEALMSGLELTTAGSTAVFSTTYYEQAQGTYAAFDLDPDGSSPLGRYVRVDVDLLAAGSGHASQHGPSELLLIVYMPEPFKVRLARPTKSALALAEDDQMVAVVMEKAMLYLRFATAALRSIFMRRVRGVPFEAACEPLPVAPQAAPAPVKRRKLV